MGRPAFLQFLYKHYAILIAIIFLAVIMITIGVNLGLAWESFNIYRVGEDFNIFNDPISFLGDPNLNPNGYIYFIIALWTLGYASIVLLYFFTLSLRALKARVAGVFAFFFGLSIPGTFVVGVVPWGVIPLTVDLDLHIISAGIAFGGSAVAFLLTGIGIIIAKIRDLCEHKSKIPVALVIPFLVYVPFLIFGIWGQVSTYIEKGALAMGGETWNSFILWEWLLFFSLLSICIATAFPLARVNGSKAAPTGTR